MIWVGDRFVSGLLCAGVHDKFELIILNHSRATIRRTLLWWLAFSWLLTRTVDVNIVICVIPLFALDVGLLQNLFSNDINSWTKFELLSTKLQIGSFPNVKTVIYQCIWQLICHLRSKRCSKRMSSALFGSDVKRNESPTTSFLLFAYCDAYDSAALAEFRLPLFRLSGISFVYVNSTTTLVCLYI